MMSVCPTCKKPFKEKTDKYCRECGAIAVHGQKCPHCDSFCDTDDLYCHDCGEELTFPDD